MLLREILRAASSTPVAAFQALVCIPRILEIASDVKRRDSDVVHAFWARHVGLVLPVLRAERARALRSAFVGAYDLVSDDFLVDATAEAAQVIFSHAEANRAYLEKKAPRGSAIHIIRRGIPLPDLNDEAAREPFQWVTASSLIREKNVEAVLRAFAIAHRHDPRLKLKIFGDGPDRPRLERIARQLGCSDSATFAGHVRRDELFAEMQRASVFMLLSKGEWERLPNVIKEALWAGCAVISSNSTGIDELIPDDSVGYVVDPDNEASVNVAVTAVLDASDGERALSRRNARAHIARHFSTAASMRAYAEIWQSHCPPLAADPRPAWTEPSCDNAR
jgi:glycosyltransferase involved in cell wall biosynthesis